MQLLGLIIGDMPELDKIAPLVLQLHASALPAETKRGGSNQYMSVFPPSEHAIRLESSVLSQQRALNRRKTGNKPR